MKVEIDTEKDSPEAIREIIRILTTYPERKIVSPAQPAMSAGVVSPLPSPPAMEPVPVPPPPPAAADAQPESPPITPVGDLDVNGKSWDSRIHASTKTKTKDGAWKYMRGLAEDVRKTVEAEEDIQHAIEAESEREAPTPSEPVSLAGTSTVTPSQIIARVSELRAMGKMDDPQLAKICAECGIESIAFIMGQTEQICVKFNDLLDESVL